MFRIGFDDREKARNGRVQVEKWEAEGEFKMSGRGILAGGEKEGLIWAGGSIMGVPVEEGSE